MNCHAYKKTDAEEQHDASSLSIHDMSPKKQPGIAYHTIMTKLLQKTSIHDSPTSSTYPNDSLPLTGAFEVLRTSFLRYEGVPVSFVITDNLDYQFRVCVEFFDFYEGIL